MDKLLILAKEVGETKKKLQTLVDTPPEVHHFVGEKGIKGDKGDKGLPGLDAKGDKGDPGKIGKTGDEGKQGVSIVDVSLDFDNGLTVSLSDGSTIEAGQLDMLPGGVGGGSQTFIRGNAVSISTEIVAAEHFVKSAARLVQTQDIIAKMAI
jgi:hypothetical protein